MKLEGKFILSGKIITQTGLHIGGSKNTKRIGDIDNNIIKSAKGLPYIPGSSLKGKLRSMLTKEVGTVAISLENLERDIKEVDKNIEKEKRDEKLKALREYKNLLEEKKALGLTDEKFKYLYQLFGSPGTEDSVDKGRLFIRDAYLDKEAFEREFGDKKEFLDFEYSQSKFENVINRVSGTALHPRQLERVPAGAEFIFRMVYDVYNQQEAKEHLDHVLKAMLMLQDDYLGGSGSRGYGEIAFNSVKTEYKSISEDGYMPAENNELTSIFSKQFNSEV